METQQPRLAAVAADALATEDFLSVQAGTMPVPEFFDPANVTRYLDGAQAARVSERQGRAATTPTGRTCLLGVQ